VIPIPRADGTGPEGKGPLTGRGRGGCDGAFASSLRFGSDRRSGQNLVNLTAYTLLLLGSLAVKHWIRKMDR